MLKRLFRLLGRGKTDGDRQAQTGSTEETVPSWELDEEKRRYRVLEKEYQSTLQKLVKCERDRSEWEALACRTEDEPSDGTASRKTAFRLYECEQENRRLKGDIERLRARLADDSGRTTAIDQTVELEPGHRAKFTMLDLLAGIERLPEQHEIECGVGDHHGKEFATETVLQLLTNHPLIRRYVVRVNQARSIPNRRAEIIVRHHRFGRHYYLVIQSKRHDAGHAAEIELTARTAADVSLLARIIRASFDEFSSYKLTTAE